MAIGDFEMAKVITLTGLGETMDFATPEALACMDAGGTPVWDDGGGMVCEGVPGSPVAGTTFDWKTSLKYVAVGCIGSGLGYFALNKKMGGVPASALGGAAALGTMFLWNKSREIA